MTHALTARRPPKPDLPPRLKDLARQLAEALRLAQREAAQDVGLPAGETTTLDTVGVDKQSFIEDVRRALYASKLVSYAQGLDMLQVAGAQLHPTSGAVGVLGELLRQRG